MKYFYLIIFLLLLNVSYSYEAGDTYVVTEIDHCVGQYTVKVRQFYQSDDTYLIRNCKHIDYQLWKCFCSEKNVTLMTRPGLDNEFDIVIEYYLDKENKNDPDGLDRNKRTYNFNNIVFGVKPVEEKSFFDNLPSVGSVVIPVLALLLAFVFLITLAFLKLKSLYFSDENEIEDTLNETKKNNKFEDEVNKILEDINQ